MFRVPLQPVAELPRWMTIAPVSAELFISGQLKVIPLFRYPIIRVLPTSYEYCMTVHQPPKLQYGFANCSFSVCSRAVQS